ncbi:MAG: phage minor head protein [Pseudomonadota bacterium]
MAAINFPPQGDAKAVARLPFQEQIDFFMGKLALPTERWDDIQTAAHDRAWVVAGAQAADLLQDLADAVAKAIAQGSTLEQFRKDFDSIVGRHGWSGWTGDGTKEGRDWRTRVIYQTNLNTSYSAGRLKQLLDPDLLKVKPFWTYRHRDSVLHPRPLHVSWNGITLPANHPWFQTHYTPNGWGCQCYIVAVSIQDAKAWGLRILDNPPDDGIDPRTGAPMGIDKGWDYMPGARAKDELQAFVDDKLIRLSPQIGAALAAHTASVLQ